MDLPSAAVYITVEQTQVPAVDAEALAQAMGQSVNFIIDSLRGSPLGSLKYSDLTESQFQLLSGPGWVLCDGRALAVTDQLRVLTGLLNIPDLRGRYARNLVPPEVAGSVGVDDNSAHTHTATLILNQTAADGGLIREADGQDPTQPYGPGYVGNIGSISLAGRGDAEFRPKTTITNAFIRIN